LDKNSLYGILIWVLFFVVFYFILIRPQRKRDKELKEMRGAVKVGDEIVTVGGIVGNVAKVEEDVVIIELGPSRTKVPVERWAIGSVKNQEKLDKKK
jgi:preprotein translocase subunit YajC